MSLEIDEPFAIDVGGLGSIYIIYMLFCAHGIHTKHLVKVSPPSSHGSDTRMCPIAGAHCAHRSMVHYVLSIKNRLLPYLRPKKRFFFFFCIVCPLFSQVHLRHYTGHCTCRLCEISWVFDTTRDL